MTIKAWVTLLAVRSYLVLPVEQIASANPDDTKASIAETKTIHLN